MEIPTPSRTNASPSKAIPIPIPTKPAFTRGDDEYSLKQSNFDPNKFSPPSSWNNRLRARLGDNCHGISQSDDALVNSS